MSERDAAPRQVLGTVALAVLAFAVYWPALRGGWVFDDTLDVTENRLLRDVGGLWKIWFQPTSLYDYYPIKYTVQWVQWQLWGENTLGYHVTNVALHTWSAWLFWRVLQRLGSRHGWVGAVLFVVHPLAVESVAWITELKNTLSLPLLLLAFLRFIEFERAGRRANRVAAVLWFLAALLCKTSVVMFPVTLLVFVWWRRGGGLAHGVRATAPLFALSLAFGLLTLWFQHHRAIGVTEAAFNPVGGAWARLACAGSSLGFYAVKTIAPVNLMTIYPQWPVDPPSPLLFLPWLALGGSIAWFWRQRATWGRPALFGTSWFVLHLLPVLGFVPISSQRFTWVMDHLAYVALLGPLALAVAAVDWLPTRTKGAQRWAIFGAVAAVAGVLAIGARGHARTFRSEEALWLHNVERNPAAWMALYNLGNVAGQAGRPDEAIRWYRRAIEQRTAYPEAWNNLGNELRNERKFAESIDAYREVIRLKPDHFAAHNNLGASLAALGQADAAIAECELSLRINPRFAPAQRNLGAIRASRGEWPRAVAHLQEALRLQPDFPAAARDLADAYFSLGNAGAAAGQDAEALAQFERALQVRPEFAEAAHNAGVILGRLGRPAEAVTKFKRAVELKPDYADALVNLAFTCQAMGNMGEAVAYYEAARKLRPELPPIAR